MLNLAGLFIFSCLGLHLPYLVCNLVQMYEKALKADPSYKLAAECLAIVLTDLGTSLKLAGNTQEGIQKYYEAIKIDPHYAVILHFPTPIIFSGYLIFCSGN